jgi:CO/xanthine dehydrogenase FAD-binding subunit
MAMLSQLEARRPTDLAGALALLTNDDGGGAWRPLAGGTDLLVEAQHGKLSAGRFMDLSGLRGELGGLCWEDDGGLVIGALASYLDVQRDGRVQATFPALCAMSRLVGAVQIQARGTLAGNVENGSPAADVVPALMALDARVRLQSAASGKREVPLADYYTGYRSTQRRADELIVALALPAPRFGPEAQWTRKVGTRAWQAITKVGLAAQIGWREGRVVDARLVAISMAATVCRLPTLEAALVGEDGRDLALWPRLRALQDEALRPIDDVRSTGDYRAEVFARLVRQAVEQTRARAD